MSAAVEHYVDVFELKKRITRGNAGLMVWNLLADSLRDPTLSINSFISVLKTRLFAAQRDT